jgi:hypothetical protein
MDKESRAYEYSTINTVRKQGRSGKARLIEDSPAIYL